MTTSIVLKRLAVVAVGATLTALGTFGTEQVNAASLNNGSGLASPTTTIRLDEVVFPVGTTVTNQYASFGVTFSNLFYSPQNFPAPNVDDKSLGNFILNVRAFNPFSIKFLQPSTGAAFAMITNPGRSTFTALLNGSTVETFTAATNFTSSNNFYGFTGITFDEIQVSTTLGIDAALIDNLQFGSAAAVPTPALLPGLIGLGLGMLRKRKAEAAKQAIEV